jgi:RNA polymerase sigma-70 factor (ECF subfamily)
MERQDIGAAINCLPHSQREAMRLMRIQGLSLREASVASGLSIAALKVASHRALRRLRSWLQDKGEP